MSYTQLVEAHHRLMYADNVRMVAQQMQNPLRAAVTVVPGKGESMNVADLFGKKKARRAPDRDRTNPDNPTPRSARWLVRPEAAEDGELIDKETKWDSAMDPTSMLFKSNIASVEREIFDCILGIIEQPDGTFTVGESGILGSAREGKRGATTVAFPPAQTIVHGSTGLTLDKLRAVRKGLRKNDFGMEKDDQIFGLITPEQEDDLLAIAAATGANLNSFNVEQLREGKPSRLMGFDWIMANRVPLNATGQRMCPFWSKANIVAAEWQPVTGDMWNDTSKKNLPYIYVSGVLDATRVEDKGVYVIECSE